MNNRIDINVDNVMNAVNSLSKLAAQLDGSGIRGHFMGLDGFSLVSGLDGVGRTHSRVSSASAPEANRVLGEWLQTVADVLRVSAENTSRADGSVAGLLGSIGVVERTGGAGAVAGLMGQTLSQYENANSFANPRPAAGGARIASGVASAVDGHPGRTSNSGCSILGEERRLGAVGGRTVAGSRRHAC